MADQCTIRVIRELRQLEKSDSMAMAVHYQDGDIRHIQALLIGPPGTPYALGFYQFAITIPRNYPAAPPKVLIRTTNNGRTRFGPNLYASGKVCLSILGTWSADRGEEWSPAQGLESVLLSIQSLLSSEPYTNEPGFEDATDENDHDNMQLYNAKIAHENLRLAVIAPLESAFNINQDQSTLAQPARDSSEEDDPETEPLNQKRKSAAAKSRDRPFDDYCKQRFLWYLELYKQAIQEGINQEKARHLTPFPSLPFEHQGNTMNGNWDYHDLHKRLVRLETELMKETHGWPAQGLALVKDDAGIAVSLRGQHEQIVSELSRRTGAMVDLTLVDNNPFLWLLTYFGRPMTQYDGGVLRVKIYISPKHPVEQPRVFLETPLYHVRVSAQNALIYLPSRAEEMSRHIEGIINSLEEVTPPFNPLMTVNPEATKLCWGSKEEQRLYSRKLRRSVEESLEHIWG